MTSLVFNASKKLEIVKIEDNGNCATLVLHDEDHTLGNALRYMIMKNPSVKFCGYSMPHPNERKVILQIQTYPKVERSEQMEVESESGDDHSKRGKHKSPRKKSEKKSIEDPKVKYEYQTAMQCFEKGFRDLIDVCEHIKTNFGDSFSEFKRANSEMGE